MTRTTAGVETPPDPRPLTGEPVSMDLINTVWAGPDGTYDLLGDLAGLRIWLGANGLHGSPASARTLSGLLDAREALRKHVDATGDDRRARAAAETALNDILAGGVLIRTLDEHGPGTRVRVTTPEQLPAWTAVEDYLQLLARDPARIRRCAHPDCVLHFYDTSKRGDRRWCSMAGCGNRAKAARHYARTRPGGAD